MILQDICGALVCNVQSFDPNSNHLIIWMKEMVDSANVTRDELVSYARRWFCKVFSETMIGMVCVTLCDDSMPIWERKKHRRGGQNRDAGTISRHLSL